MSVVSARSRPGPSQHAPLLFVDIQGFSSRSDREQLRSREGLYGELRSAFTDELWRLSPHEDRGDGVFVVVPPELPVQELFTEVLPRLEHGLGARRRSDPLLRLRIAVHAGAVHRDGHGFAGNAVNHVFRLCDGEPLRRAIGEAASDTAVLVSEVIHDAVVRAGLPGVEPTTFHAVTFRVKETHARAWLHVAGDNACAMRIAGEQAARQDEGREEGRDEPRRGGVSVSAGHDVRMDGAVVAGGDVHLGAPPVPRSRSRWWRGAR
ncbi:adenylate/guanylate cyclase [Streptomyces sp. AK08-02]|uniref:adenylate/guanylate cyclase n=1 Tax=Streptomyces sp. AK08-02 TaxID=3028654 RepID=UPI0029C0809A|nr:adenylate/guanylate cyclase [Streptomyces sp. AK08-02]